MLHADEIITIRGYSKYNSWSLDTTIRGVIEGMESFGKRLRRLRKEAGLGQTALATRCKWENNTRISNYETETRTPDLNDIRTIAEVLRVTPHYLAFGPLEDEDGKVDAHPNCFVLRDPAGKSMVIAPDLAMAIEDLLTAWATTTVTKRQLHAYRTMFCADANIDPPPPLPKETGSGIKKSISKLKGMLPPDQQDDQTSH